MSKIVYLVHLSDFKKAVQKLEEALSWEQTEGNRDAAILRFELSAELAWKSMRDKLKAEEVFVNTPIAVVKEAYKTGLIEYDGQWIELVRDRNIIVHTYSELQADELYQKLPKYKELFNQLLSKLEQ